MGGDNPCLDGRRKGRRREDVKDIACSNVNSMNYQDTGAVFIFTLCLYHLIPSCHCSLPTYLNVSTCTAAVNIIDTLKPKPIQCQVRSALTASGALLHGMTPAVSPVAKPLAVSGIVALVRRVCTAKYLIHVHVHVLYVPCLGALRSTRAVSGISGLIRATARNSVCSVIKRRQMRSPAHCAAAHRIAATCRLQVPLVWNAAERHWLSGRGLERGPEAAENTFMSTNTALQSHPQWVSGLSR